MSREKFLTQAAFAIVLAIMALLPITTYGCLKLQQTEQGARPQIPVDETGAGGGDEGGRR